MSLPSSLSITIPASLLKPIRFLISLSGRSRLWSHVAELAGAGCLVERAGFADVPAEYFQRLVISGEPPRGMIDYHRAFFAS
mgnify:CR=1 FL=1